LRDHVSIPHVAEDLLSAIISGCGKDGHSN
jgi:hypothetical protein